MEGKIMFDSLSPMYDDLKRKQKPGVNEQTKQNKAKQIPNQQPKKTRKKRKDAGHNVKFPVSQDLQRLFKASRKRCCLLHPQYKEQLKQTKYNTLLLQYALDNPHIVDWNQPYKDSSTYLHTMLKKERFDEIAGIYGVADERNLSNRKCVFMMCVSALNWIEKEGDYEEIIKQVKPTS